VELLQCLKERGDPIDKSNRVVCAAERGRRALDGRSNGANVGDGFRCGFSGYIYGCDIRGIELVGWGFLVYS